MQLLKTIYLNDISRIALDADHRLITNTWLREVEHEEMVLTAQKLEQFLVETGSEKLLLNALQVGTLPPPTKEWLSTTYYKSLSDLGIKKLARVLPSNLFNKLSFEAVMTRAEAMGTVSYEVRNFSNDEAALRWLRGSN